MDTNPKAELEEVKQQRELQIRDVISGNLRKVMRDEMKPNYLADTSNKQSILNTCMEMALSLGADVFVKQSQALRDRHDQQETLRGLDIPVLVLCGSEDRLCSLEQHQLIHKLIPNSWLEVVMDAGHLPTLEQPEKTTEILKTWLKN
jgi:pimeloyl-ACP methyl ester carboxylesterase